MKRVWLATALILVWAGALVAQETEPEITPAAVEEVPVAQAEPYQKWEVHVGGGLSKPSGAFAESVDSGPVFGGGFGYFINPRTSFGLEFNYEQFGAVTFEVNTGFPTIEATSYQVDLCLQFLFDPKGTGFYLKSLLGMIHFQEVIVDFETIQGITRQDPEVDPGSDYFHIGQGIGLLLKGFFNLNLFAEAIVNGQVNDGGDFWFANLRTGIFFRY